MPTDAAVLKRLRSGWLDPDVTRTSLVERYRLTSDDVAVVEAAWGPKRFPERSKGDIRKARQSNTYRLKRGQYWRRGVA